MIRTKNCQQLNRKQVFQLLTKKPKLWHQKLFFLRNNYTRRNLRKNVNEIGEIENILRALSILRAIGKSDVKKPDC